MTKSFHENEIHFLHRLTSAPKRFIDSFFTPVSVKRYHLLSHELYHTSCPKYNNPPVKLSLNISFVLLFFYIVRSGLLRFYIENVQTLLILGLGLVAFIFDTAGGVLFAKFMNLFMKKKVNPMIGAAGISAFPMSSRVVHKMGLDEDPYNFLLMHSAAANVSGQIASVIAGGLILGLL